MIPADTQVINIGAMKCPAEVAMVQVSVIIPAYNAERTITRAIDSALAQNGVAVEVIVVDDCSTDGTGRRVVDRYPGHERVSLVSTPVNSGPSAARNVGIEAARGEWIALLDADDWMAPERLGVLLASAAAVGADFVADSFLLCTDDGNPPHAVRFSGITPPGEPTLVEPVIFIRYGMGSVKPVIRRDFLLGTQVRFDPAVWRGEDMKFFVMLMLQRGRFALVDRPMYYKQETPGSLTKTSRARLLQDMREVFVSLDELSLRADSVDGALRAAIRVRIGVVEDALAHTRLLAWMKAGAASGWPGWATTGRAIRHLMLRRWRFPQAAVGMAASLPGAMASPASRLTGR